MREIDIPPSVRVIKDGAFQSTDLKRIHLPYGLKNIGDEVFRNCDRLNDVYIPETVEHIGTAPFRECLHIKKFHGKYASNDGTCLIYNGNLISVVEGIRTMDDWRLPNSVCRIGNYAFSLFYDLKSLNLSENIIEIGKGAFHGCEDVQFIKLPSSIKEIKSLTFAHCHAISHVDIPSSVEIIEKAAFFHCASLSSITLSASLKKISGNFFIGCSCLKTLYIPAGTREHFMKILSKGKHELLVELEK